MKYNEAVENILERINEYNEEINSFEVESKKIEKDLDSLKDKLEPQGFTVDKCYLLVVSTNKDSEYIYLDTKLAKELNNKAITKAVRMCKKNGKINNEMIQRIHWKNNFIDSMINKFTVLKDDLTNKEQTSTIISYIIKVDSFINKLQSLKVA